MPEDAGAGQVPGAPADASAGAPGGVPAGGQDPQADEKFDAAYVRQLRSEAAKHRTDLRAATAELEQLRARDLSETQKLQQRAEKAEKQAQEHEARMRETLSRLEIERAARKLSLVDEDAAYKLLDHSQIEFADDGRPVNIERLLTEMVQQRPYLREGSSTGSVARPNRPGGGERTFTASQIADRRFYEANTDAIDAAYREGRIVQD